MRLASRALIATLLMVALGTRLALANDCVQPGWKVTGVRLPEAPTRSVTSYVELGDVLAVTSPNLPDLRKCAGPNNPILLYLNGMPLKGMPDFPPSNPAGQEISYTLKITSDNRAIWNKLLGRPAIGTTRPVEVSVGLADGFPIPSDATMSLRPLPPTWFTMWVLLFIAGLSAFFLLARKSRLLRGGTPGQGEIFSISKSQAAWWFFLILAAYLLIGMTTGDYTTSLNSTALTLLGISSATYLGSVAVDVSKDTEAERTARDQERARLQARAAANTITADERVKLGKLNGESQGWLKDVLSDSEGVDFHRFQMLVWSVVLGIIFITRVWQDLAMPEFDATLLGLTGLSAGTFIGLKIPETTK